MATDTPSLFEHADIVNMLAYCFTRVQLADAKNYMMQSEYNADASMAWHMLNDAEGGFGLTGSRRD